MKKLNYLFALLFLFAAFVSCDKRNIEARLEALTEYTGTAIPIESVGNTSCEDLDGEYLFSSGRVNYVNGIFDFSDVNSEDWPEGVDPVTGWPNGLSVTVSEDGRYVSFEYTSDSYCVGAAIVKGGNASNVYTYNPATKKDANLSAPVNASGFPAGLSNLTFCFMECQEPAELVIALKTFLADGASVSWAVTNGEGSEINNLHLGYIDYVYNGDNGHELYGLGLIANLIGTIEISDYTDLLDGKHYLEVVMNITSPNMSFLSTYLYVGTVAGYNNYLSYWDGTSFADYYSFPFIQSGTAATRTFKIPFNEITE